MYPADPLSFNAPNSLADPASPLDPLALADFSRLVESIYEGPLESPPWKSFLELLRGTLSTSFATLILRPAEPDRPSVMVFVGQGTSEASARYDSHFFALDPFVSLPHDQPVTPVDVLGERAWLDSTLYREYLRPLDILHILGVNLAPSQEGEDCRLRVTRPHGMPPFGEREKAVFALLLPHLKRAVRLASQMDNLNLERKLLAVTVERMQLGTVTLDEKGAIVSVNEEARTILDQQDGIRLAGGALRADYPEEQAQLQKLIAAALMAARAGQVAAMPEAISITRRSGRARLSVLVRIIAAEAREDAWSRAKVAVFLRNPEQQGTQSLELVRRLFELTHAEASLAMLLANGLTLDEASEQLNIRRNTARAHLRSIFSKMGVTRQTELVRLVLNSVAQLG